MAQVCSRLRCIKFRRRGTYRLFCARFALCKRGSCVQITTRIRRSRYPKSPFCSHDEFYTFCSMCVKLDARCFQPREFHAFLQQFQNYLREVPKAIRNLIWTVDQRHGLFFLIWFVYSVDSSP